MAITLKLEEFDEKYQSQLITVDGHIVGKLVYVDDSRICSWGLSAYLFLHDGKHYSSSGIILCEKNINNRVVILIPGDLRNCEGDMENAVNTVVETCYEKWLESRVKSFVTEVPEAEKID